MGTKCWRETFSGEKQDRLASQSFRTQLHQAIVAAAPVPKPQALDIQHTLQGNQPVFTAHITNAAIAQRLYSALLTPSPGMVTDQTLRGDTTFWNLLNRIT